MTLDPRKPSVNFWGQTYTFDICINFKGSLIYGSDREMLLPGNMEGLASGRQALASSWQAVVKGGRKLHLTGFLFMESSDESLLNTMISVFAKKSGPIK